MLDRYEELNKMSKDNLKTMLADINAELGEYRIKLTNARIVKLNTNAENAIVNNDNDVMTIEVKEVEKIE